MVTHSCMGSPDNPFMQFLESMRRHQLPSLQAKLFTPEQVVHLRAVAQLDQLEAARQRRD